MDKKFAIFTLRAIQQYWDKMKDWIHRSNDTITADLGTYVQSKGNACNCSFVVYCQIKSVYIHYDRLRTDMYVWTKINMTIPGVLMYDHWLK